MKRIAISALLFGIVACQDSTPVQTELAEVDHSEAPRYRPAAGAMPTPEAVPLKSVSGAEDASGGKRALLYASDGYLGSLRDGLVRTGAFASSDVSMLQMPSSPPSLDFLKQFDCIIVWTNNSPPNPQAQGDRLKEFAMAGGRVVISTYGYSSPDTWWELEGGIMENGFSPLGITRTRQTAFPRSLDFATARRDHPLLAGVEDFSYGGNSNYVDVTLDAGATLVARDNHGIPLVAINAAESVVGINLYPGGAFAMSLGVYQTYANACGAVANRAPSASAGGPYSTTEGTAVTLTATGEDPEGDDLTYAWDTDGDGAFDDATDASINLTFPDNRADGSAYEVKVRVSDTQGASAVATAQVEVANALPVVDAGADLVGNPGVPVTLAATFTDAGRLDKPWKYTVNWGDGSDVTTATVDEFAEPMAISASHSYETAKKYVVTVSVEDKDGAGTGMDQLEIDIANRAPTAAAGGPYSGSEGAAISFAGSGSDPDGDAIEFAWDFDGDGDVDATTAEASFAYPDDGAFEAELTVTDASGASATSTATVTVENLAPSATFGDNGPVGEGSAIALSLSDATDPGEGDRATLQYAFDCGSGYGAASSRSTASCPTDDDGSRTVRAKVTDDEGGFAEYTGTVTVDNLAPTGTFSYDGPVDEGSPFRLAITGAADPSSKDLDAGLEFAFDCGTGLGSFGAAGGLSCATTDQGTRSVTGKVRDKDGGVSTYTGSVSVRNVAPSVEAGADVEVTSGGTFSLAGSFADPGADSPWSYSVAWGFGSPTTGSASAPGAVSESARYLAVGTYTVSLTVTDKDGGSGADALTVTVKRLEVAMDVLPGSDENPVHLKGKGVLPAAVLTTADFDARLVDVASVRLGPGGATEVHGRAHHEDVDGDGDVDLVLHFDTQAVGLTEASTSVSLTADLTDGRQIAGSDAVRAK